MIDLNKLFDRINKDKFNGEVKKVPATWNSRLSTSAGICKYTRKDKTPTNIELSQKIFSSLDFPMDEIEATMLHEMCHVWLLDHYNYAGHNYLFQNKMKELTGEDKDFTYHTLDMSLSAKIQMTCNSCGMIAYRGRMPKKGKVLIHTGCGGKVSFTQINQKQKTKVFI